MAEKLPVARRDLSRRELRQIFLLLGELSELKRDPRVQHQHMLDRLCELLHCRLAVSVIYKNFNPVGKIGYSPCALSSDADPDYLKAISYWLEEKIDPRNDRLSNAFSHLDTWRRPLSFRREDLVHHRTWFERDDIEDLIRHQLTRDNIFCSLPLKKRYCCGSRCCPGCEAHDQPIFTIALVRGRNMPLFTERDSRFMASFNRELHKQINAGKIFHAHRPRLTQLPDYLRTLVGPVLRGESPSELANAMDLRESTVRKYMQRLYRHFGVNSREQLTAELLEI